MQGLVVNPGEECKSEESISGFGMGTTQVRKTVRHPNKIKDVQKEVRPLKNELADKEGCLGQVESLCNSERCSLVRKTDYTVQNILIAYKT